jgi:hypothetical protein
LSLCKPDCIACAFAVSTHMHVIEKINGSGFQVCGSIQRGQVGGHLVISKSN